ncbi:MAG: leucine-rich repeat domain-containing protein [Treponemataceae bacterium]|nr:leucine-rich repeat domain-containing protein [Treponemataceae bacterium]
MKRDNRFYLFCFTVFLILAVCTACGGGGGALYDPNNGPHNGGAGGGWGGTGTNGNAGGNSGGGAPKATIVLSGGTSLGVQYYTYKGQNYYTAQDLLDVLGNEDITGTVEIPLVAADGSNRIAKYVVTERGRTLKHPYSITLRNTDGTQLYPPTAGAGAAGAASQYFYASDGFPMSNITVDTAPVSINGSSVNFPVTAWDINGAKIAANGTLIGFGEGTSLDLAPVTPKYFVDGGTLYINPTAVAAGETIKITAADGPISSIEIDGASRIALDLTDANIVDGSGDPVTNWDSNCLNPSYSNCLTGIKLPRSVTAVADDAFNGYANLQSVTLPDSVTSIGTGAFRDSPLLASINIPNGVTTIGDDAFNGCSSLASINIPNGVTSIGDYAFNGCSSLTSINIPNGVTEIKAGLFHYCTNLTSVNIPASVTSIEYNAFDHCTNLTSINIPNGVTSIGDSAFSYSGLTSVSLPEGVATIEPNAFSNCTSLTSITIPSGLSVFGGSCFYNTAITKIVIPDNYITGYDGCCFSRNDNLREIEFGENLDGAPVTFGWSMFQECRYLQKITLPSTLENIGSYAWDSIDAVDRENIEIYFRGTMSVWKNVDKSNSASSIYQMSNSKIVHCSDGDINYWATN